MKKIKKIAASVAALATAAVMSVGTLAVTANEVTKELVSKKSYTVAEEQFIAAYEDEDVSKAAAYFIDNGISLSEAEKMVELYVDGKNKLESSNARSRSSARSESYPNFYSTTNLSSNQHHGIGITTNGNASVHFMYMEEEYSTSWIDVDSDLYYMVPNSNAHLNGNTLGNSVYFFGNHSNLSAAGTPAELFNFEFEVVMTSNGVASGQYNENTLRNQFVQSSAPYCELNTGSADTSYVFETYINGDVNHDGTVDSQDYAKLVSYNIRQISDFSANYSDMDSSIAAIINGRAADADENGEISIADISWVMNHMG